MNDARERGAKSQGDRYLSYLMFLGAIMIMPMAAEQYPPPAWPPVLLLAFASLVTGFTLHPRIAGSRVGSALRVLSVMSWASWLLLALLRWL